MAGPRSRSTRSSAIPQGPAKKPYKEPPSDKLATISSGWIHLWTQRERIALRILTELFPGKPDQRTTIFNTIFAAEHAAAGFPGGRDHASLRAQWSDRTRPDRAHWDAIKAGPQNRTEQREWAALEREVRRIAGEKGVAIRERETKAKSPPDRQRGKVRKGREVGVSSRKTKNEKLQQQAIGRSRKGGKFVKETKAKPRVSDVREQRAVEDAMEIDEQSEESHDGAGGEQDKPQTEGQFTLSTSTAHQDDDIPQDQDIRAEHDHAILDGPPLPMIHTSQVEWASTDAFWTASPRDGLTQIPTTSAIYRLGGKVHRVNDVNSRPHHYILCNPSFCTTCSPTAPDPATAKSPTSGLPFVHAKDVQRIDGKWRFMAGRGEGFDRQNTEYTESFRRNVVFGDGVMRTVAVCTYAKCRVCREHTAIQRRKGGFNREVEEG